MLQEIQTKAVKINNRSDTLRWGSCLKHETLVLVCGHPSVPSLNRHVLYFVAIEKEGKVTIRAEFCGEVLSSIHVLVAAQAVDFILKYLKEVFK